MVTCLTVQDAESDVIHARGYRPISRVVIGRKVDYRS